MNKIKKQAHRVYTVNGERIAALLLTRLTYLCQFSDTSSHDNVPSPFLPRVDRRLLGYPVQFFTFRRCAPNFPPFRTPEAAAADQ